MLKYRALAGVAICICVAACSKSGGAASQDPAPIPVVVAAVEQRELPVVLNEVGTVESTGSVAIQSRVDGQIVKVFVADGQDVKAGEPLIQIDPAPLDIQLRIARATLARDEATLVNAQSKADRGKSLLAQKYISEDAYTQLKTDLQFAHATVDADRAAVDNAALQLSYATIVAPVAGQDRPGQSTGRQHDPRNGADPTGVAERARSGRRRVLGAATATRTGASDARDVDAASARDSRPVSAASGSSRSATLTFIDNAADSLTGTIRLRARFDNQSRALWPGAVRHGGAVAAGGRQVDRGADGCDRRRSARPVRLRRERIDRRTAPGAGRSREQRVDDRDGRAGRRDGRRRRPVAAEPERAHFDLSA